MPFPTLGEIALMMEELEGCDEPGCNSIAKELRYMSGLPEADQRNFCRERVTESDAAYLDGAARGMRILAAQFGLKQSSHWAEASLHARATADRFATYAELLREMMRP